MKTKEQKLALQLFNNMILGENNTIKKKYATEIVDDQIIFLKKVKIEIQNI